MGCGDSREIIIPNKKKGKMELKAITEEHSSQLDDEEEYRYEVKRNKTLKVYNPYLPDSFEE